MNDKLTQQEINQTAGAACNTFRSVVNRADDQEHADHHR